MNIIIKATNTTLTPSIRNYIEEKIGNLEKFLKHIDPDLIKVQFEIERTNPEQRQGDVFRAEVNVSTGKDILRAENTHESLYAAIDLVKDELTREIKKHKEKQITISRRGARSWKKFWQINPFARFRKSGVGKKLIDE